MIQELVYKRIVKPVLFQFDPESVHDRALKIGRIMAATPIGRALTRSLFFFRHPALRTLVAGIQFDNPIGLAAGFDKNARLFNVLPELGFGFAELGSVTAKPCAGNPRPRLFRVPQLKSIIVNYGLCNDGAEVIRERVANKKFRIPIGLSVARTNTAMTIAQSIEDYCQGFRTLHSFGAYTTVNVSCPNSCDNQTFCEPENLNLLLTALDKEDHTKPVFLKLKPDLAPSHLAEVVAVAERYDWVTGYIVSNLTKDRTELNLSKEDLDNISAKGGLSGLPVKERSTKAIKHVRKLTNKVIIGCGGVFSGQDAFEKLAAGANLIQLVSALIFEGPGVVSKINRELVDILQKKGFGSVTDTQKLWEK